MEQTWTFEYSPCLSVDIEKLKENYEWQRVLQTYLKSLSVEKQQLPLTHEKPQKEIQSEASPQISSHPKLQTPINMQSKYISLMQKVTEANLNKQDLDSHKWIQCSVSSSHSL